MSKSLPNPAGDIFTLDISLLSKGKEASRCSPRLRVMQPIQRTQEARVQRLLNFLQPGTYIQPHCHPLPHASESISLLSGKMDVLIFDEVGKVTSRVLLSPQNPFIDIEPGTWHGMVVREVDTVVLEFKQGPYDAITDKLFARWAPEEGNPDANAYLDSLARAPD